MGDCPCDEQYCVEGRAQSVYMPLGTKEKNGYIIHKWLLRTACMHGLTNEVSQCKLHTLIMSRGYCTVLCRLAVWNQRWNGTMQWNGILE
jgi:hypothetical protein